MPRGRLKSDNPSKQALYMRAWRLKHPENATYQREYHKSEQQREKNRKRANEYFAKNRREVLDKSKVKYASLPKKGRRSGVSHHGWKGEGVGYHALHTWIKRQLGSPSKCSVCGTEKAKRFEWANKDHKYQRRLEDWMRVCTKCHRNHDFANGISQPRRSKVVTVLYK